MTEQTQVAIAEATASQLREFAQTVLGVDVAPTTPAAGIRAKIAAAGYDKDTIPVNVSGRPEKDRAERNISEDFESINARDPEGFSTIIIQRSTEKMGDQPVWLCVNGVGLFVPRGIKARIKNKYIEVLENAIETIYEQDLNDLRAPLIPREVLRHPFSIVGIG
jgi:hypothetical protein